MGHAYTCFGPVMSNVRRELNQSKMNGEWEINKATQSREGGVILSWLLIVSLLSCSSFAWQQAHEDDLTLTLSFSLSHTHTLSLSLSLSLYLSQESQTEGHWAAGRNLMCLYFSSAECIFLFSIQYHSYYFCNMYILHTVYIVCVHAIPV